MVHRDGRRVVAQAGRASLAPTTPVSADTLFHLFSGTKVYTAAALMVLADRGAVSLDDSVSKYLGDLKLSYPITLRQLASHQSGLPDTLRAFLAVHLAGAPPLSTKEALARFSVSGGQPPGQRAAYRNVNFAILGEVIARVTAQPFCDFVRNAVLQPLKTTAHFETNADPAEPLATGYQPRWSPMRLLLPFVISNTAQLFGRPIGGLIPLARFNLDTAAIGGLLGSAEAFLPMLSEMLSSEDGVLSAGAKRQMLTLQAHGAAGVVSRVGVGLAWKMGQVDDTVFWNHEGGGPGFCTETRLYPEAGLGFVILMNRTQDSRLSRLAHDMCEDLRKSTAISANWA
jgi:CubicO group peptidase (beta-lactamase class C family)